MLEKLTKQQREQVTYQFENHKHQDYKTEIFLSEGNILKDFVVHQHVLRPEVMTARYLARSLFFSNRLFRDKIVVDMGCGTGIQAVVAAKYGAGYVIASDRSKYAVENVKANKKQYSLRNVEILHGDLFEKIHGKADIIIFNHPFFPDDPVNEVPVSMSMLDDGQLINRFLRDARQLLNPNGLIIMPYYHPAGPINNPNIQARRHEYQVKEIFGVRVENGLQQGNVSIYHIFDYKS